MIYKSGQIFLPFCHNPRVWRTDRQTDGQAEFSSLDRVCIPCSAVKIKHTDLCYFHMQLTWLVWSRSRSWSRSFWSRSHNRFLVSVSVSVSISVSHSLVSVLALVSLCSGLINKPGSQCAYRRQWLFDDHIDVSHGELLILARPSAKNAWKATYRGLKFDAFNWQLITLSSVTVTVISSFSHRFIIIIIIITTTFTMHHSITVLSSLKTYLFHINPSRLPSIVSLTFSDGFRGFNNLIAHRFFFCFALLCFFVSFVFHSTKLILSAFELHVKFLQFLSLTRTLSVRSCWVLDGLPKISFDSVRKASIMRRSRQRNLPQNYTCSVSKTNFYRSRWQTVDRQGRIQNFNLIRGVNEARRAESGDGVLGKGAASPSPSARRLGSAVSSPMWSGRSPGRQIVLPYFKHSGCPLLTFQWCFFVTEDRIKSQACCWRCWNCLPWASYRNVENRCRCFSWPSISLEAGKTYSMHTALICTIRNYHYAVLYCDDASAPAAHATRFRDTDSAWERGTEISSQHYLMLLILIICATN